MAFPSVVARTESAITTAGTSFTVNFTQTTDDLVVIVATSSFNIGGRFDFAKEGFTEIVNDPDGVPLYVAYKVLDGSEGGSIVATADAAERACAIAYNVQSFSVSQAPEIAADASPTANNANPNPPNLAPTGGSKDYLWIAGFAQEGEEADDDTWCNSAPTNFTNLLQKTTGTAGQVLTNASLATAERTAAAASQDPGTFNTDQALDYKAFTIAVHPAGPSTQTYTPALINQAAATFAPTIIQQQFYTPALLDQTAVAHQPTIIQQQFVSLGLIDRTAATFDPQVNLVVFPGFINQAAATFTPTISAVELTWYGWSATFQNFITQDVALGLINQTATPFAPTVSASSSISLALIDQTATASAPSLSLTIYIPLIDRTAATFTPTVTPGAVNVSLGLIDQTAATFAPSVATVATISLARIDQVAQASEPTITTGAAAVSIGLINQTAATFTPTVVVGQSDISLALINQTATLSAPTVSTANTVSLALINQTAVAFAPSVSRTVSVDLIDRTAQTFTPTVTSLATISVGLINQAATATAPTVSTTASVSLNRIEQTAATFAPTAAVGAAPVVLGRIDQTAQPFTPTVAVAGVQSLQLPVIDRTATTFAPTIRNARRGRGGHFGPRYVIGPKPLPEDQFVGFAIIAVNAKAFAPTVERSDDEVLLGLSDEDLLVLV